MHPIAAQQNEIPNFAVLNALMQFLHRPAVSRHQPHSDFKVLGRRRLGQLEHSAGAWAIDGERLLHENIEVLLNGISEMDPAERWRSGENRNVARFEAIEGLLVSIEADKLMIL